MKNYFNKKATLKVAFFISFLILYVLKKNISFVTDEHI